jgi:phage shock protein PspC (stress-responsive transcriptional regulator)
MSSYSDELARLADLHQRGVLSDEEFARAKARVLDGVSPVGTSTHQPAAVQAINDFRRSSQDRWIAGVCGGLGRITGIASWAWRLGFTLLLLCGGTGLLVYVLMWIFVPLSTED